MVPSGHLTKMVHKHSTHKTFGLSFDHHCLLLRQFLSLLPEDSVIFLGAGSPCPDLTIIGRGQGLLGLAGDRSVLIHCVWAVVYYLSFTPFWKRLVILAENAGSMKDHMKQYIHQLFGIPLSCGHYINCNKWGSVSRARNFFTVSDTQVIPLPPLPPLTTVGLLPSMYPLSNLSPYHHGYAHAIPHLVVRLFKLPWHTIQNTYSMIFHTLALSRTSLTLVNKTPPYYTQGSPLQTSCQNSYGLIGKHW